MHIRCGLGCRLSGKTFVRAIANYLASEALELDGAALHMLSTGEDEVLRAGGVGRQGGAGGGGVPGGGSGVAPASQRG